MVCDCRIFHAQLCPPVKFYDFLKLVFEVVDRLKWNSKIKIVVAVFVLHTWVALLMIVLYLLAFELKVAVSLSDGVLFHLSLNWLRSCSSESFSSFNKRSHSSRISVFLVNRSGSSSINFLIQSVPPASLTADDFSFNDCGSSFP